jgi:hypothetical protein
MLTSWSEVSTPAELSMASVLMRTPASAASMRPSWVKPRLPPSPTTLQRSSPPLTRSASLARSPTSAWLSAAGLDVGADAAVVEQVDRRLQDRRSARSASGARRRCPARRAPAASDRHRLGAARPDPAAGADQRGVVVGPRRARQLRTGARARRSCVAASGSGRGRCGGGRTRPRAGCGATAACRCRTRRPTCRRCRHGEVGLSGCRRPSRGSGA